MEQFGKDDWYRIIVSEDNGLSWNPVRNGFKSQFFTTDTEKYKDCMFTEPTDVNHLSRMKSWLASLRKHAESEYEARQQWGPVDGKMWAEATHK